MDSISFFWSFFKMLSALALVIAMMIGAMFLIKKYFYQSPSPSAADGNAMIDIISTCHLGPKNCFMLIEVLGQVLLVGISNQEMSVLTTVKDPEALEKLKGLRLRKEYFSSSEPFSRYVSLLRNLGRRRKDR